MGKTGETFIVGPDDLMRSNSRLFLEDPNSLQARRHRGGHAARRRRGRDPPARHHAGAAGRDRRHQLAQQGQRGTLIANDYLGHETLQAYAPARHPGAALDRWSRKIDTSEAFAPVSAFTRTLVLSTAAIIFVVCIAAMLLARLFVRPIRRLEAGAQQISAGDYDVDDPVESRDEFGDLTVAFNDMSRNLGDQGGPAQRAAPGERPAAAVADARAGRGSATARARRPSPRTTRTSR